MHLLGICFFLRLVCNPASDAKYIAFKILYDPDQFPGQRGAVQAYEWPYSEGLRLDEAMNDLTLMTTGTYGKDLLPQNGAPTRLMSPWKFDFLHLSYCCSNGLASGRKFMAW